MAKFDPEWVRSGIRAGLTRAAENASTQAVAESEGAEKEVYDLVDAGIDHMSGQVSKRFVVLAAEITSLAWAARSSYDDEAPLDSESVIEFIARLARFVNSWNHERRCVLTRVTTRLPTVKG